MAPYAGEIAPPPAPDRGKTAWFKAALRGRAMTTGYVIVRRGSWFIVARGSSPDEAGSAGVRALFAGVAAIDWERLRSADAAFNPPVAPSLAAAGSRGAARR